MSTNSEIKQLVVISEVASGTDITAHVFQDSGSDQAIDPSAAVNRFKTGRLG